jgi:hypothetical protein
MSIHTDKSYNVACRKDAFAAANWDTWNYLTGLSKRELAEVALHLAALSTGEYDDSFLDGRALTRVKEEVECLRLAGLI